MRVRISLCVWMSGLMLAAGCSSTGPRPPGPSAAERARWVAGMGGVERCAAREAALATMCASLLATTQTDPASLRLRVLRAGPAGAYAFPPNAVYVTARAFERWPEDELTAAVAHELGHLLDQPWASDSPAGLIADATPGHLATEMRADRIGRRLLRDAGQDPTALSRLLSRLVADAHTRADTRAHLSRRIAALASLQRHAASR